MFFTPILLRGARYWGHGSPGPEPFFRPSQMFLGRLCSGRVFFFGLRPRLLWTSFHPDPPALLRTIQKIAFFFFRFPTLVRIFSISSEGFRDLCWWLGCAVQKRSKPHIWAPWTSCEAPAKIWLRLRPPPPGPNWPNMLPARLLHPSSSPPWRRR